MGKVYVEYKQGVQELFYEAGEAQQRLNGLVPEARIPLGPVVSLLIELLSDLKFENEKLSTRLSILEQNENA